MITRVVFEFSVAGGVFPRLTHEAEARVRVIAMPRRRPVPAFEQHRDGRWHQMPLGEVPPELLMTLAALLAGAPQPGKPLFMETRIDRSRDQEIGETLTIVLGLIAGEPFEATVDVPTLRDQQLWLGRITTALGVEHHSLCIHAIDGLKLVRDACLNKIDDLQKALSRMNEALNDGYESSQALLGIAEDLKFSPDVTLPGWAMKTRDACLHTIAAMRSTIDLLAAGETEVTTDHLDDLGKIAEALGIKPLELSADTRDAIIKEIRSLKATNAAPVKSLVGRDDVSERFQILKQALLSVAREIGVVCDDADAIGTIRNRSVDELRNERSAADLHLKAIGRALGLGLPAGGADARDRIIKAIEALKADWPANLAACAELVHDREEKAVAFRNKRMEDVLVAKIADGRANYKAEPLDAILHATALAHEVRTKRADMSTLKERAQSLLAVLTRICQRAGCMLPNKTIGDIADAEQRILAAFDHLYQQRNNAMRERNQAYDAGVSVSEALRAVAEATGIEVTPTEDGSWAEPTRSQIVMIIDGLKEINQTTKSSSDDVDEREVEEALEVLEFVGRESIRAGRAHRVMTRIWAELRRRRQGATT